MNSCRSCGISIRDNYLHCFSCNRTAKTYKDEKGYVRFKNSDKPLHRHAAEKKLGRELRPREVVHHINRNKSDNKMSNLWVFRNQQEHDRAHKEDAKEFGKKASYQGFKKKRRWSFW